jgi:putative transposase
MPNSYTPVHIHFVWATFDRQPLILPEWEHRLHAAIGKKCETLRAQLLAVNSMPDHVHVLVRLPATVSLAQMAMHLKGATSHLINSQIRPPVRFQWQGAYAAFCVCPEGLDAACAYIRNQKRHHSENSVHPEWERTEE